MSCSTTVILAGLLVFAPCPLGAQGASISLADAREAAQRTHPAIVAAREAVIAAEARERQSGVMPNPTFTYGREQVSGDGQSNAQDVASLEQPIELGLRSRRRDVARARREAAEARLALARIELDHDVTVAYAQVIAADRRARIAAQAGAAFTEALRVSEQRLAAGDIAGYAHRRLRLEAARAATLRAEALLAARSARVALASLVRTGDTPADPAMLVLADTLVGNVPAPAAESLVRLAAATRADLLALTRDADAAAAEARLVARERLPVPVLSAGFKRESIDQAASGAQSLGGFVAGISVPLPVFDRRTGAIAAADAEARRQQALMEALRRRVAREVLDAHDAYRVAQEQLALLEPVVGPDARAALAATDVAYAEGEITLAEWLDVMRSFREAEASLASLQSEVLIRRAALERAVGAPISQVR